MLSKNKITNDQFKAFEKELEEYIYKTLELYNNDKEEAVRKLCKLDNHLDESFDSLSSFLRLENAGINTIELNKVKLHH